MCFGARSYEQLPDGLRLKVFDKRGNLVNSALSLVTNTLLPAIGLVLILLIFFAIRKITVYYSGGFSCTGYASTERYFKKRARSKKSVLDPRMI